MHGHPTGRHGPPAGRALTSKGRGLSGAASIIADMVTVEPDDSDAAGYDIIGDIHGCAAELESLLAAMDYLPTSDGYRHRSRRAIFVGDLIDRGPDQLRVLQIVKAMVDAGSAQLVLGNHEFNALAYATEWPPGSGTYLRPHDDPGNPSSAKNTKQHRAFLEQVTGAARTEYLDWLGTQPLWLDLGRIRVVHACWHAPSMQVVTGELGTNRLTTVDALVRATTEGDRLYSAIETLLKGPEISLTDHGQPPYLDKDGHPRGRARLRWWNAGAETLRDIAEMGGGVTTVDGAPYPVLPELPPAADESYVYDEAIPVFYGHYWRHGSPERNRDFTDYTACVDFSAVNGGPLVAYRWSGEARIDRRNYQPVPP